MKSLGYDAIVWGGTGWNMLWSFGVSQFFLDTGIKSPAKVGVVSGGCMSALAHIGAANQHVGIVQCEQLHRYGDFMFNDRFRRRYRRYFETFANTDCMETLKEYDFYATHTQLPSFKLVKDNVHGSRNEFLDKLTAGCHVPFLFGTNIPMFYKGSYIVDTLNFRKTWWEFPDNNTLVISPSESSSANIIGGNLSTLSTIGLMGKMTYKNLFLKGYRDAAEWYGNVKHDDAWVSKGDWRNKKCK
jgi:hypothetical protein